MNKLLSIVPILFLSACTQSVPIKNRFPEVPESLLVPPKDLIESKSGGQFTEFLKTVTDNYSTCDDSADRLIAWQTWYREQQKIYKN